MKNPITNSTDFEREREELRQERETFQQQKGQATRWSTLRLVMGYCAIALMVFILFGAFYILLRNDRFPSAVVVSACGALFLDALGLLITIWKMVLNNSQPTVTPVTKSKPPDHDPQ